MKFSLFYVLESPDHDFGRAYREMLEQVELAERLGFHEVWLAEHHGSDYGSIPSPQIAAAAIAQRTERIRIGIAVSNLTFDWPVRIAEDYAMVDVLSGGRLDLGVGRGYQPHEFRAMGVGDLQDVSREVFAESLQIVNGLWTADPRVPFSFHGKHFRVDGVTCRPRPVQQPAPPIYIASISPETFDLVADAGHHVLITPTLMTLPQLNALVVDIRRSVAAKGGDPGALDIPMNWQIHLADDEATAVEQAGGPLEWYFRAVAANLPQGPDAPHGYEEYSAMAAFTPTAPIDVNALRESGVCYIGDPAGLVREVTALRDETGLDHLICWMRFGGMPHDRVVSSMRLLAEHVMPALRDTAPMVPRALRAESRPYPRPRVYPFDTVSPCRAPGTDVPC